MPNHRLIKRDVFKVAARWQAADRPIDPRCKCKACAKMLVMARPGVMGLWIETILDPRDHPSIQMIIFLYGSSRRVKKSFFARQNYDPAANRLCAARKLLLVLGYPVRSHLAI